MNKEIDKLIAQIASIPTISKKGAEKITFNLLKDQESALIILENIKALLKEFSIDELTEGIVLKGEKVSLDSNILYIFENNREAYNVLKKLGFDKDSFIINFYYKSDYTNLEKINKLTKRLINYIINLEVKEIVVFLPPRPETELLFRIIKQKLLDENLGEIIVTKLATGIPFNGSIEYLDEYTLKEALDKRGEK